MIDNSSAPIQVDQDFIDTSRLGEKRGATPGNDNFWYFDTQKNQVEVIMKSKEKKTSKAAKMPIHVQSVADYQEQEAEQPKSKKTKSSKSIFSYADSLTDYFKSGYAPSVSSTQKAQDQPAIEVDFQLFE